MTTETFPTLSRAPTELPEWALVSNTFAHTSPYTRSVRTVGMVGSCWAFNAIWRNRAFADRAIFEAFLAKLNGVAGRFYFSHPFYAVPRGTARGTGTVSAATQFATTVTLNGLAAGATILAGDFIEITTALLIRATSNGTATGGGVISNLPIAPMLRVAVTGGTAFTLVAPKAQFRLNEDRQGVSARPHLLGHGIGDFQLNAIEAF